MLHNAAASNIPNAVTRTLLCIDSTDTMDFVGTMYNPYFPEPVAFQHVKDVFTVLDSFFDDISYPQPSFDTRSFLSGKQEPPLKAPAMPQKFAESEILERCRGEIATFLVEVRFRQNATWQGALTWMETGETRSFRSALEMIMLMDHAVNGGSFATAPEQPQ